jgi:hypothetical protein
MAPVAVTLILLLSNPSVSARRCQISDVTYAYPHQVSPNVQIRVETTVAGSCATNGEDYYSVRVDLVDASSSYIISSNSTPIGYFANNFTVTVENLPTTPSNNGTWSILIHVYVIRAGGTGGSYLLDYTTVQNATIQIGPPPPIPEFPHGSNVAVAVLLCAALLIVRRRKPAREHDRSY